MQGIVTHVSRTILGRINRLSSQVTALGALDTY